MLAVNILRQMTIGRYKNLTPRLDLHFYDAFKMIIGSKMAISFFMKKDLGKMENTIAFFFQTLCLLFYIKKETFHVITLLYSNYIVIFKGILSDKHAQICHLQIRNIYVVLIKYGV